MKTVNHETANALKAKLEKAGVVIKSAQTKVLNKRTGLLATSIVIKTGPRKTISAYVSGKTILVGCGITLGSPTKAAKYFAKFASK